MPRAVAASQLTIVNPVALAEVLDWIAEQEARAPDRRARGEAAPRPLERTFVWKVRNRKRRAIAPSTYDQVEALLVFHKGEHLQLQLQRSVFGKDVALYVRMYAGWCDAQVARYILGDGGGDAHAGYIIQSGGLSDALVTLQREGGVRPDVRALGAAGRALVAAPVSDCDVIFAGLMRRYAASAFTLLVEVARGRRNVLLIGYVRVAEAVMLLGRLAALHVGRELVDSIERIMQDDALPIDGLRLDNDPTSVHAHRAVVAIQRILEPLLETAASGFVERHWSELSDDELTRFTRAGIAREELMHARGPMVRRAQYSQHHRDHRRWHQTAMNLLVAAAPEALPNPVVDHDRTNASDARRARAVR